MTIKCLMLPHISHYKNEQSGIRRVVEAYFQYLPLFDVELVHPDSGDYDLLAVHAGTKDGDCDVAHVHGLYWTADYAETSAWQWSVNAKVINNVRHSRAVTVPSPWVAESFQRDMHMNPDVIPHGVEWDEWQHNEPTGDYILWNKNRNADVCDPYPVLELARRFPNQHIVSTFLPQRAPQPPNVNVLGIIPYEQMKKLVQSSLVYLATTKETFGIGTLEAMAAGIPVLGFDHGGNAALVETGVNGYLVKPGDYDALAEGLVYCVQHRHTLGENGREMARQWTWQNACEKLAGVYKRVMQPEEPTVSIVIPCYNKSEEQLGRAVQSAVQQTYDRIKTIVVVDDGSDDPAIARNVVDRFRGGERHVELLRTTNFGVAKGRNSGISLAGSTKYSCCLDADDAIEPEFIRRCVDFLEDNRSVGIAYTSLLAIKPDGTSGVSKWPPDYEFDGFLRRQNQIPTCCVFRRKIWERLGGYRQRYAPGGAGAEDVEFWFRAGAAGWSGRKVTNKPLFLYSWQSGQVSGDPEYQEVDWHAWHPWTKDQQHPFASLATPERFSHPVRQYDEPVVSIIIPVGPGHEEHVANALDSLEAQTFRQWEAIVVWDNPDKPIPDSLVKAYPFIRVLHNAKARGAGGARNNGVLHSRAPFLVFLDADDWLYPEALEKMTNAWADTQSIVYTDYVGKAFVDDPQQLDPALQENMYFHDPKTREAVIGHRAADYDCERAMRQPEGDLPYIWANVTALIPKTWHDEIGGFDEQMDSWEDLDYHWRLAKAGKCYYRIAEELLVYRFHTGHRRERGRQAFRNLLQYLIDKHKEIEVMPCPGCPGRKTTTVHRVGVQPAQDLGPAQAGTRMPPDGEFVMCEYSIASRGERQVYGGAGFQYPIAGLNMTRLKDKLLHINYGYRDSGARFLVHVNDVRLAPHMFRPVVEERIAPPPAPTAPPSAPQPIVQDEPEPTFEATGDAPILQQPASEEGEPPPAPIQKDWNRPMDLQALPGVGTATASKLEEAGIRSANDLLALGVDGLSKYAARPTAENIIETLRMVTGQ